MKQRQTSYRLWYMIIILLVISAVLFASGPVVAINQDQNEVPGVPASYYGDIIINGDPADSGTTIEAVIDGEIKGSITVENSGKYGGSTASEDKLTVKGNFSEEGKTIRFYIDANGYERGQANQTINWKSGAIDQLNLSANLSTSEDTTSGNAAPISVNPGSSAEESAKQDDQTEENSSESETSHSEEESPDQTRTTEAESSTENETPGFGFSVAIITLLLSILFANQRLT